MFLVDDILMSPARGLFWVFKEIYHAAEEEQANEAESITAKLSEIYMMLETKQMTEAEFDAAEKALLDRLDAIKEREGGQKEDDGERVVIRKRREAARPLNCAVHGPSRHSSACGKQAMSSRKQGATQTTGFRAKP